MQWSAPPDRCSGQQHATTCLALMLYLTSGRMPAYEPVSPLEVTEKAAAATVLLSDSIVAGVSQLAQVLPIGTLLAC